MKLSEELIWRGFVAETTLDHPEDLDTRENKKFYWGADPSADSLTIGNLAALMMCACFVRHGYESYWLVGGATGQIGDPKDNGERELKSLAEVEYNKGQIRSQIERIIRNCLTLSESVDSLQSSQTGSTQTSKVKPSSVSATDFKITLLDNYDWFKQINFLDFLREVGKSFSMTQLLDRQFVQNRIGAGGAGISYAEFSYTLIQGYDFLHLFRQYGVDLQLCGADQFGNCASGIHLIKRLENARADVWSTPLIIDPVTGRKFGKSEGNAVWLASGAPTAEASTDASAKSAVTTSKNFTTVFDFYQFWLNQADSAVEYLLKIYTLYSKAEIERILQEHQAAPERRIAQRALAQGVTSVVHGSKLAEAAAWATDFLFAKQVSYTAEQIASLGTVLPSFISIAAEPILDASVRTGLASSKSEAKKLIKAGAISFNGEKINSETTKLEQPGVLRRGKNKFAVIN